MMKKILTVMVLSGLAMELVLGLAGCAAAVREGRPRGANFSPDDYYRIGVSETGASALGPAELVNPLMGTDSSFAFSHGNVYPAVARPWGMNGWTAQTGVNGYGWGYTYRGTEIRGFKQTHQPSPWAGDYGCFSLMPMSGKLRLDQGSRASGFRHAAEVAKPYYYRVELDRYRTVVEITATERAGVMRFSFPDNEDAFVVVDVFGAGGEIEVKPAERRITGFTTYKTGGAPDNFRNWFVVEFDADIALAGGLRPGSGTTGIKVDSQGGGSVTVKIGSSFISLAQAELNLSREVGERSFEEIKDESRAVWDRELSRVAVSGGTLEQRVTFYSALYRMLLFPRVFHEVDGAGKVVHYSPYNGEVRPGFLYTDTGFWDTFRALFPFLTIMYPERDAEIMQGLLNAYQEGGRLPSWSSPGYYDSMIGAHPASALADAYVKGIRGFDAELAWEAMVKDAEVPEPRMKSLGRCGVEYYNRLGYVPCDVGINENAARTLEYAYDDFCLARFGRALGRPAAEVDKYLARSFNYRNLFDPSTNFMRGKKENGEWREKFNPFAWGGDFTEGSSWHYTWSVFQDPQGLIDLMGGREAFVTKLDALFTTPPEADYRAYGYKIHEIREMQAGGMGQYAHGNQPIQHAIYLYDWAGEPWQAQARAREVLDKLYNPFPNGYCGDEDNGQTSAWYVFSALGFYPVCPGTSQYALGSPLFAKAVLSLDNGRSFTVEARNNSPANVYIARAFLNGREFTRNYLTHEEIIGGGTLVVEMDSRPNLTRGVSPDDAPYSLSIDPDQPSLGR